MDCNVYLPVKVPFKGMFVVPVHSSEDVYEAVATHIHVPDAALMLMANPRNGNMDYVDPGMTPMEVATKCCNLLAVLRAITCPEHTVAPCRCSSLAPGCDVDHN